MAMIEYCAWVLSKAAQSSLKLTDICKKNSNAMHRSAFYIMSILSPLFFLACKSLENRPVAAPAGFDWQGHRGCRGLFPENSIPAFLHALEYPEVVTLELDLAVSKDKRLIVSHEPWMSASICSLPNGDSIPAAAAEQYLIYQYSAEEIRQFDCGSRGNPRFPQQQKTRTWKPTLQEVVEAVRRLYPEKKVRWNIEIKSAPDWDGLRTPPIEEFAELVIREVKALQLESSVVVQSFDVRPLQILHQRAGNLRLAFLVENTAGMDANLEKLGFTPHIYSPYYLFVDRKMVNTCKKKGMQLIPWTVNDVQSMRRLIRLGVDGIITDYPNLIAKTNQ
jgi:glycerophosphoryl diester phosphodiesterase